MRKKRKKFAKESKQDNEEVFALLYVQCPVCVG